MTLRKNGAIVRHMMESPDSDCLFSAISAFLCAEARRRDGAAFWASRPRISRCEMEMLAALSRKPACAAAIAAMLGRCPAETEPFLDALVAVGIVEVRGAEYAATAETAAYCWMLAEGQLPSG